MKYYSRKNNYYFKNPLHKTKSVNVLWKHLLIKCDSIIQIGDNFNSIESLFLGSRHTQYNK